MTGRLPRVAMIGALLMLAACRQPDGPRPTPEHEQPNKIYDVGRDLQAVAARQAGAEVDLFDDIQGFDSYPPPPALVKALVAALQEALSGVPLADAEAQQLAGMLFVATTGHELSRRQIGRLGEDMTKALLAAGANPDAAQRVTAATAEVAAAVTRNRQRWYHLGT